MKKKLILLLLLLSCFMTLQGCGKTQEEPKTHAEKDDRDEKNNEDESNSSKKDKDDSSHENKDAKNKLLSLLGKADLSPLPIICFESENVTWYDDDSTTLLCEANYQSIYIEDTDYSALSEALTSYSSDINDEILAMAEENVDYCSTDPDFRNLINEYSYLSFDSSYMHTRFDHKVLSLWHTYSDYLLGPHGSYSFDGITFDVATGERILLADLIKDNYSDFENFAKEYLLSELLIWAGEDYLAEDELASTLDSCELETYIPWYLNGSGLVFIINPYTIGPYAMGSTEVCIPYSQLFPYIKEEYLPNDGAYIGQIFANVDSRYGGFPTASDSEDLSDEVAATKAFRIDTDINGEYEGGVLLSTATSEEVLTDYGYFQSAYFVRKSDGKDYLLTCIDQMSGDYDTTLYQLENGSINKITSLPGNQLTSGTVFENSFMCTKYFNVLGTYDANITYSWNDDNSMTLQDDVFHFNTYTGDWRTMTTLLPLPVTINGEETSLPIGTVIQITGYDGGSTAFFKIVGSNETGEIHFEKDDYIHLIDGVSEYDYFDFPPYAG
ncbi:MAG: DUF3298 domain-containing protein [Lachnospiraceae bacterium]|nr:DUF3298 domain-containing protein [Lachnospiraceae bacterium]